MIDTDKKALLQLARQTISAGVASVSTVPPNTALAQYSGVVIALYNGAVLRGRSVFLQATRPLYRAVALAADQAAFHDLRFPPVAVTEIAALKIEINVLSALMPIGAGDISVDKQGLYAGDTEGKWAVMLPHEATANGWTSDQFFAAVCKKGGFATSACCVLKTFTAETFSE